MQDHHTSALLIVKQLMWGVQSFHGSPAVTSAQGEYHLVHAGIPALQEHPIMCVDPYTWSIALSPDRKALAVFRGDQHCSLSSLLSGPAMINLSIPVQPLEMYEYAEQPSITAMVFSGEASSSGEASLPCALRLPVLYERLRCKSCDGLAKIFSAESFLLPLV